MLGVDSPPPGGCCDCDVGKSLKINFSNILAVYSGVCACASSATGWRIIGLVSGDINTI